MDWAATANFRQTVVCIAAQRWPRRRRAREDRVLTKAKGIGAAVLAYCVAVTCGHNVRAADMCMARLPVSHALVLAAREWQRAFVLDARPLPTSLAKVRQRVQTRADLAVRGRHLKSPMLR